MEKVRGTVKWFSNKKGYGFIIRQNEQKEDFVHYSCVTMDGYKSLKPGQVVEYDISTGPNGDQAGNVKIICCCACHLKDVPKENKSDEE